MPHLAPLFVLGLGILVGGVAHAEEPNTAIPPSTDKRPRYHGVDLASAPAPAGKRPAQEVKVLLETPHVKLATITLRDGKVLEAHSAPTPVTIQALRGRGIVQIGDAREPISVDRMVVLAPGMKHAVVPDGKDELVLLVHHMKPAPGPGASAGQGKGSGGGR